MANVNLNNAPLRLDAGGAIEITPVGGSDTYILRVYESGTLQYERGGYTPLSYTDFDKIRNPLRGAERVGRLQFSAKFTGVHDAEDLAKILAGKGANGLMKLFNIVVKFRDNGEDTAAAGQSATFSNCCLSEGGLQIQSGTSFDTISASFMVNSAEETTGAVTYS